MFEKDQFQILNNTLSMLLVIGLTLANVGQTPVLRVIVVRGGRYGP